MNFAKNNFRDWKTIREIRENFCPRTFLAIRYDIHRSSGCVAYIYVHTFKMHPDLSTEPIITWSLVGL